MNSINTHLINKQQSRPWLYVILSSLYFFYEFFQINSINTLSKYLMQHFQVHATMIGFLGSSYFYGSLILLLPAGILLDRYSAKKIFLISFGCSVLGTLLFSCANSIGEAMTGRFLAGLAGGPFCLISALYISYSWFERASFSKVAGLTISIGTLGGICAQLPFSTLIHAIGWKQALHINALVGILFWILTLFFVKEKKTTHASKKETPSHTLLHILRNKNNGFLGISAGLINLPIFIYGALWGNYFFNHVHHYSYLSSSILSMLIYVGMFMGSLAWGHINQQYSTRRLQAIGISLSVMALMFMNLNIDSFFYYALILYTLGFSSAVQILAYSEVTHFNTPDSIGKAESFITWQILAIGGIAQPISGLLIQYFGEASPGLAFHLLALGLAVLLSLSMLLRASISKPTQVPF